MKNDNMSYVAIIGGFYSLKDPAAAAEAKKTAREIGAALAREGMGLVVYFSNDESLEPHVVSGYVKALPAGAGAELIRVRFAESQKDQVKFAEEATHKHVFKPSLFAGNDWEAPFYRSLAGADGVDAVLLMAGARSTLIAGQIALARPLPVLAIDRFDGSAKTIRTELATGENDYPSSRTHNTDESVAWLKAKCDSRAREKAEARDREKKYQEVEKKYQELTSQKRKACWAAGAFIALLAAILWGFAKAPDPSLFLILTFIGLIAAGATGALVRSVFWGAEQTAPFTSLVLGGIAGFVVGVAYIIPLWVGAPKVLEASATEILPHNKIQLVSAVLVAISAGVGFDTIFNRLKGQADTLGIGAPGPK